MGTRAIYTFKDENGTFHVYKHWDGYPEGALDAIKRALPFAWELPRFEADEFSAAFVAGNKPKDGGNVRLLPCPMPCETKSKSRHVRTWREVAPPDIQYRYEITRGAKGLHVAAYDVSCSYPGNVWSEKRLYSGTLAGFQKWNAAQRPLSAE